MAAIAWGCALIAATIILAVLAQVTPDNDQLLTALVRLAGLVSGLCFWAGFFPPYWLSQTWRLPELLGYLRPTRLMAVPSEQATGYRNWPTSSRVCAPGSAKSTR